MGFQRLLAGRYIFSQKRHSILTICSIAAALTLMTMLFTGFSTILGCLRANAYDKAPYHYMLYAVTKEQGDILKKCDGIESCSLVQNRGEGTFRAVIFLEKDVRDDETVMQNAFDKAGTGYSYQDGIYRDFDMNLSLLQYDFIGVKAWYNIAQIFALFYVFVIFLAMAMRLVIDTAFEISSKERERQFGVLQSIGATPKQVVGIITMEGTLLSVIGIPVGILCGIGLTFVAFRMVIASGVMDIFFTSDAKAADILQFTVNPWLLLIAALTGYGWVWLSAYATGMRIIKMSPMQAISSRSNSVKKVRKFSLFGLLFGWVGKVAARNTRRAPKRFAITVVSLTISITLFASFSYVLDSVEKGFMDYMESFGISYDFFVREESEDWHPLSYQKSLKELEECGYFTNVQISAGGWGYCELSEDNHKTVSIEYHNEASYNALFEGAPPVSYEELAAKGGYIMLERTEECVDPEHWESIQQIQAQDNLHIKINRQTTILPEEYESLSAEEQKKWEEYTHQDGRTGEMKTLFYIRKDINPVDFGVTARYTIPDEDYCFQHGIMETGVTLVATLSQYETEYLYYRDHASGQNLFCDLADESMYREAVRFLKSHDSMTLEHDMYVENKTIQSTLALVKLIMAFIIVMIALIAIVNLINIISTGILNRRSELASMQCVGMTDHQLIGLTAVECLQYAVTSGIVSSLLAAGMLFGTEEFLRLMTLEEDYGERLNYAEPLPMIWAAAAAAFIVAFCTALFSLHGMKKQSLVEQIQSVD